MNLILVRHGETVDNKKNICQGQTQGLLNENGKVQAQILGKTLADTKIDFCYVSDLHRAVETCESITAHHPELCINKDIRLRERYLGSYQGKVMPKNWNSLAPFENAESIEEMYQRVTSFIYDMKVFGKDKTLLIVSHGITLRVLTATCLGYDVSNISQLDSLENCSISRLAMVNDTSFTMHDYNDVSHFVTPYTHSKLYSPSTKS